MPQEILHHTIHLMEFITEKEYSEINQLQELCYAKDQTNLKLELDYKLHVSSISKIGSNRTNEFLYYVNNKLVAYLGISCFGENIGELNGMTHPDWRRNGLFHKLFLLAANECAQRNFSKILLISDGKSTSGIEFIKSEGGIYYSSEYRMRLQNSTTHEDIYPVSLRPATKEDHKEIANQNMIFFNDPPESENAPIEEDAPNIITYMVELSDVVIGKIKVEYSDTSAFIFGFGIMPDYRGKGYGKAALKETLRTIQEKNIPEAELDVVCTNSNALNLYKACGFEEVSIMNYYQHLHQ
jgi:ribosomal protein S18 acetylase RimI-like enzyme